MYICTLVWIIFVYAGLVSAVTYAIVVNILQGTEEEKINLVPTPATTQ